MKKVITLLITIMVLTSLTVVIGQSYPNQGKKDKLIFRNTFRPEEFLKSVGNDYSFTHSTGAYEDLTGSVSINNNQLWDDPEYVIPIGFSFNLYDIPIDSLYFGVGVGALVSTLIDTNYEAAYVILPFEADLVDRGEISGISQSPISYKLEGVAGSRILKVEWKNAGFYEEFYASGTLNDYTNIQLWIYEESNDIEMRYGPNMVTNPSINYSGETGAAVGLSDYDLINAYLLTGDPLNPTLVDIIAFLDGTPSNGTIYKFSKTTTSIKPGNSNTGSIFIFPNPVADEAVIHTDKDLKGADLTIYNSLGKPVNHLFNIYGQKFTLPVQQLSKGIYYIRITEKNMVIASEKLIRN